jgi:signal transduction histidine kinase
MNPDLGALMPFAASLALVLTVQGMRAGRRRSALNEAMHELRRPLAAIALETSVSQSSGPSALQGSSLHLVSAALERLDHEINGESPPRFRRVVDLEPLVLSAVRRWQSRARLAGGSVKMRWGAGDALVAGDQLGLSQALDNLIVNAIEHGGPAIVVEGRCDGGRLRVSVLDSGRSSRPASRRGAPAEVIARLSGKRRHGHGLAVVRRVAAEHGGRFVLRRAAGGSVAALELPATVEEMAA